MGCGTSAAIPPKIPSSVTSTGQSGAANSNTTALPTKTEDPVSTIAAAATEPEPTTGDIAEGEESKQSLTECEEEEDEEIDPNLPFPTQRVLAEAQREYAEQNIQPELDESNNNRPFPYPTPKAKADIFKVEDFNKIDKHATQASSDLACESFEVLVNHLLEVANTDLEKVRVIFRWITAQSALNADFRLFMIDDNTPAMYVRDILNDKGDYTGLFIEMCKRAGIECVRIAGSVKGVTYVPGDDVIRNRKIANNPHRSSWVAVVVDGCWHLIDPQWASRHVSEKVEDDWELVDGKARRQSTATYSVTAHKYMCNELYFLTDPYVFIMEHLPFDSKWQLLARQVKLQEFKQMAHLKKEFLSLGLQTITHHQCVIDAEKGVVDLGIEIPDGKTCKFTYKLHGKKSASDDAQAKDLRRYVFMEQRGGELRMKITFTRAGKYRLDIFGKEIQAGAVKVSDAYPELIQYMIQCEEPATDAIALPQSGRDEWGPGIDMFNMGMVPISHKEGLVNLSADGSTEIRIKLKKELLLKAVLAHGSWDAAKLKNYIMERTENGCLIYNVKPPQKGDFSFGIFANEKDKGDKLVRVCDYLLRSSEGEPDKIPFPVVAQGRVGVDDQCKSLGLERISHKSSVIKARRCGEICIVLKNSQPMDFHAQFYLQEMRQSVPCDQYVFHEQTPGEIKFLVSLPKPGVYLLKIYGRLSDSNTPTVSPLQDYLIFSKYYKPSIMEYPKPTPPWGVNCKLIEPMTAKLRPDQKVKFAIKIPGMEQVSVARGDAGDKWYHGKLDGDIWCCEVESGKGGEPLHCMACDNRKQQNYQGIITYQVMTADDVTQLEKMHAEADEKYKREDNGSDIEEESTGDDQDKEEVNSSEVSKTEEPVGENESKEQCKNEETVERTETDVNTEPEEKSESERDEKVETGIAETGENPEPEGKEETEEKVETDQVSKQNEETNNEVMNNEGENLDVMNETNEVLGEVAQGEGPSEKATEEPIVSNEVNDSNNNSNNKSNSNNNGNNNDDGEQPESSNARQTRRKVTAKKVIRSNNNNVPLHKLVGTHVNDLSSCFDMLNSHCQQITQMLDEFNKNYNGPELSDSDVECAPTASKTKVTIKIKKPQKNETELPSTSRKKTPARLTKGNIKKHTREAQNEGLVNPSDPMEKLLYEFKERRQKITEQMGTVEKRFESMIINS